MAADTDQGVGAGVGRPRRLRTAGALADPTRHELFSLLEAADGPLGVAELTEAVGVHHTVVRQHLARLCDADLVVETTAAPHGRGRPRLLYGISPTARQDAAAPARYQRLSALLADAVRRGVSARQAGRDEGRKVAAARTTDDGTGVRGTGEDGAGEDGAGVELIVAESERMGFEPIPRRVGDRRIDVVLEHCPFSDVAAEDPDTICSLHLGLAEGIGEEVGGVEVRGMTVRDPRRAGCRLHLERVDPPTPD